MKVLIDACVLYPTVMREMVLGAAQQGLFEALWSERLLEEWRRAAARNGPAEQGEIEIAQTRLRFPKACVKPHPGLEARLWLPDENDIHVLAAAIHGSADVILTMNAKDFPRQILAEEGLSRSDPDAFLLGLYHAAPEAMTQVAEATLHTARRLSGEDWTMRKLMKKARMPRLGKALES
ncbi:PIN domain-containing protein [Alphaproteobacteria bacterium KMM 3653]|uniref:PIN domain-containing protein n=1 Tax=Harenicola maris TaxID=2841044 RepID=A0AAP2CP94_9RHOB|nr:PIN domain-containing protein [Harenicola maris]